MITRCPSCATSFRITDSQLKTAKGAVRCGSCLHIFKALEHLAPGKGEVEAPPEVKQPAIKQAAVKQPAANQPPATPAKPTAPAPSKPVAAAAKPEMPKFVYKRPDANKAAAPEKSKAQASGTQKAPTTTARPIAKSNDIAKNNEKRSPAPAAQPTTAKVSKPLHHDDDEVDYLPSVSVESDELHINTNNIGAEHGQENMLVFDQRAIDRGPDHHHVNEEDLLISDDMPLDDDDAKPAGRRVYGDDLSESFLDVNIDAWKPKEKSLFDREIKPPKDDDEKKDNSDESWAVNLLEEMEDDDRDHFKKTNPEPEDDADGTREDYSRRTTGTFNALDDEDIEEALGAPLSEHFADKDDNDEDMFAYKDRPTTGSNKVLKSDQYRALDDSHLDDDAYEEEEDYEYNAYQEQDDQQDEEYYSAPKDRAALLRGIEPEPLSFFSAGAYIHWRKRLIYAGTITLGLLALLVQVAWLQFDTLSRDPNFRGWYTAFGIDVPGMSDKDRIRAYNLIVRSHPETSNALMVDTILLNTAPFNQPFPELVLSFSNINGDVLAARKFSPGEYLAGELAGKSQMPSGQPVHLSLEIVDPGPEAVNYTAYIP